MKIVKKIGVTGWIILAVNVLFLIWMITGINAAQSGSCEGLTAQDCQDAKDAGTTIGVALIVFFWAAADVILGVIWLIVHYARRSKQRDAQVTALLAQHTEGQHTPRRPHWGPGNN